MLKEEVKKKGNNEAIKVSGKVKIVLLFFSIVTALFFSSARRLIKVGSNFTSKNVCAGVFVSTMSADAILKYELQGLAAMLFSFEVDNEKKCVTAYVGGELFSNIFGLHVSKSYFIPGRGCLFYQGSPILTTGQSSDFINDITNSSEIATHYDNEVQSFLNYQVSEPAFNRNQTRGALVMHNGLIVAEAYQSSKLSVTPQSRLLGWSMTKTVHSMMIGAAIQQGMLTLDTPAELKMLDPVYLQSLIRRNKGPITYRDLITMSDILPCEENYDFTEFVPDMLFNSEDHGDFAGKCTHPVSSSSPSSKRKVNSRGSDNARSIMDSRYKSFNSNVTTSTFDFYYSSGLSNLLAKEFRSLFKSEDEYLQFPHKYLFGPIGAHSFIIETDEAGIFVASSFGYGTVRDWAKLGDLLRRNGNWDGMQVLSKEFVDFMMTARSFSGGHYGGSIWLNPARVDVGEYNYLNRNNKDKSRFAWMTRSLPHDAAMMSGFNGQYVMVIRSLNCVIVRLGFTPGVWDSGLDEENLDVDRVYPFDNKEFFETLSKHCLRLNNDQLNSLI